MDKFKKYNVNFLKSKSQNSNDNKICKIHITKPYIKEIYVCGKNIRKVEEIIKTYLGQ